jgi:hypothetical protein
MKNFSNVAKVLPDNSVLNLNVQIPGVNHYSATPTVTKYKLVHETVNPALTDTNLARLNLGVGEEVRFGFTPAFAWPPVQWSASAGGLSSYPYWRDAAGEWVTNGTGFTAPSNAANVTVTASFFGVDGSLKTKFKVLEPSGYDHAIVIATNFVGIPNNQLPPGAPSGFGSGIAGAEMLLNMFVGPTSVSFYRVQILEVGENANVTGYFTDTNLFTTDPSYFLRHQPNPYFTYMGQNNSWMDWCWSDPNAMQPPWSPGTNTWVIPVKWKVAESLITNSITGWNQVFTIDSSGTMKIEKYGKWVQRTINNVITNN